MDNIKLVLAYVGTKYAGWQKTKMGLSIEEALEQALQRILQHEVTLQAVSRTDAGVHAEGQVVNFIAQKPLDLRRLQYSLNGLLPKDISVLAAEKVCDSFHPTLDCRKKEYHYFICNTPTQMPFFRDTSWHFPFSLNTDQMHREAQALLGTHDFSAFCNERALWDRSPVCTLESIEVQSLSGQRFCLLITGDHFLYKMVRNIVGTLAYIGCGKIPPGAIPSILASRDRTQAGVTAPAHGLTLKQVFYE